eukprot:gnl/MRDRNA2_/MRDRNA2_99983_c0_seq1.p1 gnl/MRDRNA2_/MRDRNA2_99983_c0~~gnl/MRDRNA2_/MRDRNA2_99983_c0_seq1.p1  ORF type:complete len:826 (-),score=133.59 gnl/MRDRNA2_/MRDRNA2_99983_c0_seq1:43-2520(-)
MFRDKVVITTPPGCPSPPSQPGALGRKEMISTNMFRMTMLPQGTIHHYHYMITPPLKSLKEEHEALQKMWRQIQAVFKTFVVRCPNHIFSTTYIPEEKKFPWQDPGGDMHTVVMKHFTQYTSDKINSGLVGEAAVVFQHIAKKLCGGGAYQKLGRRYYKAEDLLDNKGAISVFGGFQAAMNTACRGGVQLTLDILYRSVKGGNLLDQMMRIFESSGHDALQINDPDIQSEWRRRCLKSTVVTSYNNRMHVIKAIRFDMTPKSVFKMYDRSSKKTTDTSFVQYYQTYYSTAITALNQPILEAHAEKSSETVFLVPELCSITGIQDEIRKDKTLLPEAMTHCSVMPSSRLDEITKTACGLVQAQASNNAGTPGLLDSWMVKMEPEAIIAECRVLDPLEVNFGSKKYAIDEGSFSQKMKNGLQRPALLDDWIFIYPETDAQVIDIWLKSLMDIAHKAFQMRMHAPKRIICTEQRKEIVEVLQANVRPTTQMVLLLTPQRDCKKVYHLFKKTTVCEYPCVTQVVKSETIRKRSGIAAVLSRVVLQINAKFCGPLWHIDLEVPILKPLFERPTMIIGIDICWIPETEETYFGWAASLNSSATDYYSKSQQLDVNHPDKGWRHRAHLVQEYLKESLLAFAKRNDGVMPEYIVVYRNSVQMNEWSKMRVAEIEAIGMVTRSVGKPNMKGPDKYNPHLCFIAISKNVPARFFATRPTPEDGNGAWGNPEPGTVIDTPVVTRQDMFSFYMVNQTVPVNKGSAVPTQYTVLFNSCALSPDCIQSLTYRLSYLYFNQPGSIRIPAPAQYAKKIAQFIGTAVRAEPHKRLLRTLFYL